MTASGRELSLREQFANPDEHQPLLFQSNEPHPAKTYSRVAAGVIGEDDLIGRKGYLKPGRKDDEGAWRTVADDWKT